MATLGLPRFLRDERGTASMEFVMTLPLLLAPLLITAEYGQALATREQFDSAVADATALLAVAPALPGATEDDAPLITQAFYDRARDLILERLGQEGEDGALRFHAEFTPNLADSDMVPFYKLQVQAAIELDLSLLAFFNGLYEGPGNRFRESLPIVAYDEARYTAAVPPIQNTECTFATLPECQTAIDSAALASGSTQKTEIEAMFGDPPFASGSGGGSGLSG